MPGHALRYAFDLGTNSIGWAVYRLDRQPAERQPPPTVIELLGCGVRLFDDGRNPKDGRSLAEMRRVPRAARKRRDRFVMRRATLMKQLMHHGLLPADQKARIQQAALDPYRLRAEALDRPLQPHEIGRVLMHINQRRGFQSNRRADRKGKADEKGKIASGVARLRDDLQKAGARTFGEFLWKRHGGLDGAATPRTRQGVRIRLEGGGNDALYQYYPERRMLIEEFDFILANQARHHPDTLSAEVIADFRETIFHQRPLKSPVVGKCTFVPEEQRLPRALPSVEARVIYEMLNQLRFGEGLTLDRKLDTTHRDLFASMLLAGETITFRQLRKTLKLGDTVRISLEEAGKKNFDDYRSKSADLAGRKMRGKVVEDWFGARWHSMPLAERDKVVNRLIDTEREDDVVAWLTADYKLTEAVARAIAGWNPPDGYARLGRTANDKILAELMAPDLPTYAEAAKRAGWHHSDERDGVIKLPIPYYGQVLERHVIGGTGEPKHPDDRRYGRFPNPTAHVALNQLRRVVNALVPVYGEPAQVVIELARELKLSQEQKERELKRNRENRAVRDRHRKLLGEHSQMESGENFLRLRLYEEQERAGGGVARCPFTLKPIEVRHLFSADVEIEHILPYSRTFDDSSANKVVCFREANRIKRAKAPHEAFGSADNWPDIAAAANLLPINKRWRFAPDAMERFENTERDFLSRQLNETRHISRMARIYLSKACHPDQVYVTTGQLTAMLRARWGLNSIWLDHNRAAAVGETQPDVGAKGRNDHRHHAVDAIVIGAIDRSLLNEMSRRAGQAEIEGRERITADVPDPLDGFRDAVRAAVDKIVVSVKPEHGKGAALHEDTAYGLISNEAEAAEIGNLVYRKPLVDLTTNEIDSIRDPHLRVQLQEVVAQYRDIKGRVAKDDEKAFKAALATFAAEQAPGRLRGIRRVRIGKTKQGAVPIR